MTPDIAVVVLTHNKLACTRKCLSRLLRSHQRNGELIVVDNGSVDGTPAWLDTFRREAAAVGCNVKIVANSSNVGCSTARNQGAAHAAASVRYLVFMDNDVTIGSRHWLRDLAAPLDADPGIAMTGPKLVYPFAPHAIQFGGGAVTPGGRVVFLGRGEPRDHPEFNVSRDVQCFISACCMVRRTAFERAGGFDEWFNPVEYEDVDLSYRLRSFGFRIRYVPAVEMLHFENITTRGTAALPNTYLIIRNGLRFKQRWRSMFAVEDGPPETAARWRTIRVPPFETLDVLPYFD